MGLSWSGDKSLPPELQTQNPGFKYPNSENENGKNIIITIIIIS